MNNPSGKTTIGAVGVGSGIGAALGSGIGIAGAFGAISGVLPLAALGGYVGYKIAKSVLGSKFARELSKSSREQYDAKSEELKKRRDAAVKAAAPVVHRKKR